MSGIYLHIPFCKKACHYCDFHFSTHLENVGELVTALISEIKLRKNYLGSDPIQSIYFGGGTPSILSLENLHQILDQVHRDFMVTSDVEVTLEGNPDDLNKEKLVGLKSLGINRLSVGIQSFDEAKLKFINRSHTARQAIACLDNIRDVGFYNVSADLIFAIPPHDLSLLRKDLETMIAFDLPHISVYGLTIEEPTVFGRWHKKGKLDPVSESNNLEQYQMVIESLTQAGFEHYEVSNFAKPGKYSLHNTSYWNGKKYLGIGPGAHSYNIDSRAFNISNNAQYVSSITKSILPITEEALSLTDRRNEYMMTRIRTKWGLDLEEYFSLFKVRFEAIDQGFISQLIENQQAIIQNDHFYLTLKGWFLADEISARLFLEE